MNNNSPVSNNNAPNNGRGGRGRHTAAEIPNFDQATSRGMAQSWQNDRTFPVRRTPGYEEDNNIKAMQQRYDM